MTQEEKDMFAANWRMRYLDALKHKQECLSNVIGTNADNHNMKRSYEIACYKIDLLEVENKIFWEEIVVNDWKERTMAYESKIQGEYEEAKKNVVELMKIAKRIVTVDAYKVNAPTFDKFTQMINKFDSINTSDREQLITFYQSLKLEIKKINHDEIR